MRTPEEVDRVLMLFADGVTKAAIVRATGVPYRTVSHWIAGNVPDFDGRRATTRYRCQICVGDVDGLPRGSYVYLLGLYLGDGCIYRMPKDVYRLGIFCADAYPAIMHECEQAMAAVMPTKVGRAQKVGCTEVISYSKHWPCLFPQTGPGMKHTRKIELTDWQQALVDIDPRPLIKGLIHSDGCRVLNWAVSGDGREYGPYPRYLFTNASKDIREIFCCACDAIGVEWRQNSPRNISVAKRASVAILDKFVGPKR